MDHRVDVIELRGLRVLGRHGCLPEEQDRPQPFELDLDVVLDLSPAARSDGLSDTVDYGGLAGAASAVVAGEHVALMETLAERVADALLADDRVRSVTVALRKLRPPVPLDLASAGVRITRARGDRS